MEILPVMQTPDVPRAIASADVQPLTVGPLRWLAEFHGPSPVSMEPVVLAEWLLEGGGDAEQLDRACARLRQRTELDSPGSFGDLAWPAAPDSFLNAALILVGWARAMLNKVRGDIRVAGARWQGDRILIWLGFHHAEVSRTALEVARAELNDMKHVANPGAEQRRRVDQLLLACLQHHPDYQARILMVAARSRGVPFLPFIPGTRFWQYGWGSRSRVFFESASNQDGFLGHQWQRNKPLAKRLLQSLAVPTPPHVVVNQVEALGGAAEQIGFPCVVKPLDRGGGKGVTSNIRTIAELQQAFERARLVASGDPVMVEQHIPGDDHRLMMVGGKVVAAILRQASWVTGDGVRSIRELLIDVNRDRSGNLVRSRYRRLIPMDEVLRSHLATQDLDIDDRPAVGRRVTLRSNANLSTGGVCTDVSDRLNPEVRALAESVVAALGLQTAGLDYLCTDISKALSETGGAFIEVNTTPGIDACVAAGWSEERIGAIVLGDGPGQIPIDLSVVDDRARPYFETRQEQSNADLRCAAIVDRDRIWFAGAVRCCAPLEPWASVRSALRDPLVQRLRVICTPGEIQRYGLPVSRLASLHVETESLPASWHRVLEACLK